MKPALAEMTSRGGAGRAKRSRPLARTSLAVSGGGSVKGSSSGSKASSTLGDPVHPELAPDHEGTLDVAPAHQGRGARPGVAVEDPPGKDVDLLQLEELGREVGIDVLGLPGPGRGQHDHERADGQQDRAGSHHTSAARPSHTRERLSIDSCIASKAMASSSRAISGPTRVRRS